MNALLLFFFFRLLFCCKLELIEINEILTQTEDEQSILIICIEFIFFFVCEKQILNKKKKKILKWCPFNLKGVFCLVFFISFFIKTNVQDGIIFYVFYQISYFFSPTFIILMLPLPIELFRYFVLFCCLFLFCALLRRVSKLLCWYAMFTKKKKQNHFIFIFIDILFLILRCFRGDDKIIGNE